MPIYDYQCPACGAEQEVFLLPGEEEPKACASCGKVGLTRKVCASAFHLKGSGWYATDFKGKKKEREEKEICEAAPACGGNCAENSAA